MVINVLQLRLARETLGRGSPAPDTARADRPGTPLYAERVRTARESQSAAERAVARLERGYAEQVEATGDTSDTEMFTP
jgi:hypothetical protein